MKPYNANNAPQTKNNKTPKKANKAKTIKNTTKTQKHKSHTIQKTIKHAHCHFSLTTAPPRPEVLQALSFCTP